MELKLVLLDQCWALYCSGMVVGFFESQSQAIDYVFEHYKEFNWTV